MLQEDRSVGSEICEALDSSLQISYNPMIPLRATKVNAADQLLRKGASSMIPEIHAVGVSILLEIAGGTRPSMSSRD